MKNIRITDNARDFITTTVMPFALVAIIIACTGAAVYEDKVYDDNWRALDEQVIVVDNQTYSAKSLYLLVNEASGTSTLCYKKLIDKETETQLGIKISGNIGTSGFGLPIGPYVVSSDTKDIYGFISTSNEELVEIESNHMQHQVKQVLADIRGEQDSKMNLEQQKSAIDIYINQVQNNNQR